MMRRSSVAVLVALGLIWIATPLEAQAAQQVSTTFTMPVRLQASLETSGCDNSTGPQITFSGDLELGGLGMDLIFRNNEKGTHTYTDGQTVEAIGVPAGERITIPKQPVLGGVGGNPFIWLQLTDGSGRAMTNEIYLGRCVQGTSSMHADFTLPSTAFAAISATECANSPGPYITLDGQLEVGGLGARLIFRNNDNPVGGPHKADDSTVVEATLLPAQGISFPKQPVLGGVGGNPWISLLFKQGSGEAIGSEFLIGRCEQLSH